MSEPWYYQFLEQYAVTVRTAVLCVSAIILAFFLLGYIYGLYQIYNHANILDFSTMETRFSFLAFARLALLATFAFVVSVAAYILVVVVPVLFALSLIHVVVDAGRNLRAIRANLEGRE